MAFSKYHVGKSEVAFTVAVLILSAAAVTSVLFNRSVDPGLTTAAAGIIGTIIVSKSERIPPKGDDDD